MNRLSFKLFLFFIILIILSLSLVGIFINQSVGKRFNDFVNMQREDSILELIEIIRDDLEKANPNISELNDIINNFTRANRIPIWLKLDGYNKTEYLYSPGAGGQMNQMMRRMGSMHMSMHKQLSPDDLPGETRVNIINIEENKNAYLYWKEVIIDEETGSNLYQYFKNSVFKAIIISGILVAALAALMTFFLSRYITKPLTKLNQSAISVASGHYKQEISISGKDELAELGKSFNIMTNKLEQLEKIRRDSTSDLAHELRTPVTTIKGYLEAVEDGLMQLDKETIEELKEESERLIRLINQLQEYNDAQNAIVNLKKEPIKVNPILKEVFNKNKFIIDKKSISVKLELEDNIIINADRDSLIQIFNNLIDNAIKYNKLGGTINVKSKKEGNYINIKISNTGISIDKKDLPYIFERFYRTDKSRSQDTGGTGIGLAITKELLEAHNGKISVLSNEEETIFSIFLPL